MEYVNYIENLFLKISIIKKNKNCFRMYEVFLKCWYQETPEDMQEEVMGEFNNIEDAAEFLKSNIDNYIEYYPIVEIGIRLKNKIKMITVTKIEPQIIEHFTPDNQSLGFLNEYENLDLRCQIAEHKAEGYYLIFNGEKITITTDGREDSYPNGLYDVNLDLQIRLFKCRIKEK